MRMAARDSTGYGASTMEVSGFQRQGGGVLPVLVRGARGDDEKTPVGDYSLNTNDWRQALNFRTHYPEHGTGPNTPQRYTGIGLLPGEVHTFWRPMHMISTTERVWPS
jgi:hypothetical protein